MHETRKSPRKIEEEVREYHKERFEWYMQRVDVGEISLEDAILELRSEIENTVNLEYKRTP